MTRESDAPMATAGPPKVETTASTLRTPMTPFLRLRDEGDQRKPRDDVERYVRLASGPPAGPDADLGRKRDMARSRG